MLLQALFQRITESPRPGEAEQARLGSTLRLTLAMGALASLLWGGVSAVLLPWEWSRLVFLCVGVAAIFFAWRQLERGELQRASWTIVVVLIGLTTVATVWQSSAQAAAQGGYMLAVIAAGLLLPGRQAVLVALLCLVGFGLASWLAQSLGSPVPLEASAAASRWLGAIMLGFGAVLLLVASRRARDSVSTAGQNRAALDRSNHELRASRDRYEALAEHANDLVSELDAQGRFLYVNHAFYNVLGLLPADLVGFDAGRLAAPEAGGARAFDHTAELGAKPPRFHALHKDGSSRFLENSAARYRTPEGELRTTVISRDVTDRLASERRVRKLEERMARSQRTESLGLLASGIAHDFNNLLVGILANADDALLSMEQDDPLREEIEDIARAGEGAADLVRQLLAYTGKGELEVGPLDLSDLVQDTVRMLRAGSRHASAIELELRADSVWIRADSVQIRQLILNLLTNALESLGAEGRVTVRSGVSYAGVERLAECSLPLDAVPGEYAVLEVEDDGCGMQPDTLDHVFEPFYTTRKSGRGLGLSTVLGVVRSHGGALDVSSRVAAGTTVRVLLPALGLHPLASADGGLAEVPTAAGVSS